MTTNRYCMAEGMSMPGANDYYSSAAGTGLPGSGTMTRTLIFRPRAQTTGAAQELYTRMHVGTDGWAVRITSTGILRISFRDTGGSLRSSTGFLIAADESVAEPGIVGDIVVYVVTWDGGDAVDYLNYRDPLTKAVGAVNIEPATAARPTAVFTQSNVLGNRRYTDGEVLAFGGTDSTVLTGGQVATYIDSVLDAIRFGDDIPALTSAEEFWRVSDLGSVAPATWNPIVGATTLTRNGGGQTVDVLTAPGALWDDWNE